MKYSADLIIPNSPKLPMNSHAGIPIVASFNPPMKTNVNKMYIDTTIPSEIRIARGMFFFGFLISSPACEIISYPSNAMKVNPIANTNPVIPAGKRSV